MSVVSCQLLARLPVFGLGILFRLLSPLLHPLSSIFGRFQIEEVLLRSFQRNGDGVFGIKAGAAEVLLIGNRFLHPLKSIRANGIDQVMVVDLTRAEFGLPVVRVVIPGLEAPEDDEDYVPGPRALAARSGATKP